MGASRSREILKVGLGHAGVRQNDIVARLGAQHRRAPVDLLDPSGHVIHAQVVTEVVGARQTEHEAGEEIAQGFLQSQADDDGDDRRAQYKAAQVLAQNHAHYEQDHDQVNQDAGQVTKQMGNDRPAHDRKVVVENGRHNAIQKDQKNERGEGQA